MRLCPSYCPGHRRLCTNSKENLKSLQIYGKSGLTDFENTKNSQIYGKSGANRYIAKSRNPKKLKTKSIQKN
jgi:hypothetical protein